MTTELTGAAKRLKECDFEWTSERWRGGYRVELRANKDLVCIVVKSTFEEAANAALDVAEGKLSQSVRQQSPSRFEGYTPGPWEVLGKQGTCVWAGNEIIAQMTNPRSRHRQARADAVLMASAPTLLEENDRLRARVAELEAMIKA
jgi:hypothetical protein